MDTPQEDYTLCYCIVSRDSLLARALNDTRREKGWTPLFEKGTPSLAKSSQIPFGNKQPGVSLRPSSALESVVHSVPLHTLSRPRHLFWCKSHGRLQPARRDRRSRLGSCR